jgi:hypothetical protein
MVLMEGMVPESQTGRQPMVEAHSKENIPQEADRAAGDTEDARSTLQEVDPVVDIRDARNRKEVEEDQTSFG